MDTATSARPWSPQKQLLIESAEDDIVGMDAGSPQGGGGSTGEAGPQQGRGRRPGWLPRVRRRGKPVLLHSSPDMLRLVLALVVVGLTAWASTAPLSKTEESLFRTVNSLPEFFAPLFTAALQLGTLWAVAGAFVLALVGRRPRLGFRLAVSGVLTWAAAIGLSHLVQRPSPGDVLAGVVLRDAPVNTLSYPSANAAVVTALATTAAPWLTRPWRRVASVLVVLVWIAPIYVGESFPLDVVGGAALGWGIGAALDLLVGVPAWPLEPAAMLAALAAAGAPVAGLEKLPHGPKGPVVYRALAADGTPVLITYLSREQRQADVLGALARNFAFREVTDETPLATPGQKVEHQAYIGLLAERAGVRVPRIVTVIAVSSGAAIVEEEVSGFRLDRALEPDFDAALLTDIWTQVTRLHEAGIAHRDLRLSNIFAVGRLAWIVDLAVGEAPATGKQRAQDVAELLAGLACKIGAQRAVDSARQIVPTDRLKRAVPLLAPLALSAPTRKSVRARHRLLGDLRAALADAADVADLRPERVLRIQIKTVVIVAAAGFALHLLLPQIGNLSRTWNALQDADWLILVVVFLMAALTYLAAALGIMGSTDVRLAFGRTVGVSVASDFTNWLAPAGLGGATLQVVYLERAGSDRSEAIASAGLNTAMGGIVHVSLLLSVAFYLHGVHLPRVHVPSNWPLYAAILAGVILLSALGMWIAVRRGVDPRLAGKRVKGMVTEMLGHLASVLKDTRRTLLLVGGSIGVTAAYIGCFAASLATFHIELHALAVIFVYLAGAAVGTVAPTPGGLGAIEAALIGGLAAFGVPVGPAVAATLTFRLATYWVPVVPGVLSYRVLRAREIV